jgi:hypothetical protein
MGLIILKLDINTDKSIILAKERFKPVFLVHDYDYVKMNISFLKQLRTKITLLNLFFIYTNQATISIFKIK